MAPRAVGRAETTVGAPSRSESASLQTASALALLAALAVAAFWRGAFFAAAQWAVLALIATAAALVVAARRFAMAAPRSSLVLAGGSLAAWAVARALAAGTPAASLAWVLFAAGTATVIAVCRTLDAGSREMLLGGAFGIGTVVAATGWLGVALHREPWGLPSQGLWRASATLTYANAAAALLVPLALIALARLSAAPNGVGLSLTATGLLTGAGATLSRGGAAAFAAGFAVLCVAGNARAVARAAVGPVLGAGVALLGLVPALPATAPARPWTALLGLAAGLVTSVLMQRFGGPALLAATAGTAVVALAAVLAFRVPELHGVIRSLRAARFTLASANRTGEAAAALRLIGEHPLAGVGPGQGTLRWSTAGLLHVDRYDHNEYLQVLTDLGAVGAALLAAYLTAAGRLLWRARADRARRVTWAGAVAAAVAFAVHSGFDFLWQIPAIPLTVALLVGVVVGQSPWPARPATERREDT